MKVYEAIILYANENFYHKRGMVMMGNLTHSKNLKWKKGQKLVGIKKLWMVRELFEKYSIRPPK